MKKQVIPPRFFLRFFRWFCHPTLRDRIEGDLHELYHERITAAGKRNADLKFIRDVILLFRPGIIKPSNPSSLNQYDMFKSYLTIGWRNLLKNQGYSFINIGGLAFGMAIAILIGLWIWDEITFNSYHQNYDRLAMVLKQNTMDGNVKTSYAIPRPLENVMRDTYGNSFTHLSMSTWSDENILSAGEQKISRKGNYVQVDFPEMISLKMISGTRNALADHSSVLLSQSTAEALFGTADPINQLMRIANTYDVKVAGVFENLPHNSHFREIDFLASWEMYADSQEWMKRAATRWDNNSFQLFVQLAPGEDIQHVAEKIKPLIAIHSKDNTFKPKVLLHPMHDWHLRSKWNTNGVQEGGRIGQVWIFGTIGAFVLLLACINFMNLSTARSEKRAKEVGIRMTIGSVRSQLIHQFLSESFLVVLLAFIVAMGIVSVTLPWFNGLSDKHIIINWINPFFWSISAAFILITSLLAGSYPAFFLSSFRPVSVLKSTFRTGRIASLPRKVLVVVQFTVSIALVIGTVIIYQQIQFSKNRPIGYDRNGLIMIQVKSPDLMGKYDALRTSLINTGYVVDVGESSSPLMQIWNNSSAFRWQGKDPDMQSSDFGIISVTHEYGAAVGWKIKEGRDFSRDFPDSTALILNEAAVEFIGTEDPIGFEIMRGDNKFHVIGVVKDMIMESPYKPVRPNIYALDNAYEDVNWINVKLRSDKSPHEAIAAIEGVVKKLAPAIPFDYTFADEEYALKFDGEERFGKLANTFAVLATLISCLGLIGLSSFVAEQHTKEIGIRKILGASIPQLWHMLSGNFIVLVMISSAIAIPLAWYYMNGWLNHYQYHIEMSWVTFALTITGALLITILTVSYQSVKAAMANPVKSLKSE
ncbi:MAG TPA: ABC transporter permease [Ohtaekwangia sp.]